MLSVAITGALKAVQLVLSPLHVLMFSVSTMLPIRLSQTSVNGVTGARTAGFDRVARLAFRVTCPVMLVYCGFVALFADQILELLYGATYAGYGNVLVVFAAYYVFLFGMFFASAMLTAERRTNRVFLGHGLAAVVSLAAAWPLMDAFGAEGAAIGLLLSAVVANLALWHAVRSQPRIRVGGAG